MEALRNYEKLSALQDKLGLRSPTQKLYDDCRLELLNARGNAEWLQLSGMKTIGKMFHANALMQMAFRPEEQRSFLTPETLTRVGDQYQRLLTRNMLYGEQDQLINEVLMGEGSHMDRFKSSHLQSFKQRYEQKYARKLLEKAKAGFSKGYALDLAVKELKISNTMKPECNEQFHRLQRRAAEILNRPDFKEIMEKMTAGKTAQEIREMHEPNQIFRGNATDSTPANFLNADFSLRYERRCAELTAEALLRRNGERNPDRDRIQRTARVLRTEPHFRDFIREKTGNAQKPALEDMLRRLAEPAEQSRVLTQITQRVALPAMRIEADELLAEAQGSGKIQIDTAEAQSTNLIQNP